MSVTRISGLASGLDTDSIVKKLMDVERIPLNQLRQKQQKQTWLIDTYRQLNSEILAFRMNTLFNMKLSGAYNTYDVSSSNSSIVSGTGTANSIAGTYSVAVKQLAESAVLTGNSVQLDSTQPLGTSASFTIDVVNDPNNPTPKSANIAIDTDDTISDVVSKINSAVDENQKSLGLQAVYDSNLKQFIVKTKNTGAETSIKFSSQTTEGQTFLTNTLGLTTLTDFGEDGSIEVNGTEVNGLKTNNVTILGINYTLKGVSPIDSSGNPIASTVTVSQNIDAEIKNIKDFVDKYNSLLEKMNKLVNEQVYRDYLPLLDEQRSEMSEKQIEQWEEKAKSGLLHNDSLLTGLISKMRNAMSSVVSNGSTYNSLSSIGISSKTYQDRGKLYVDETKLRAAIQADPDAVQKLFSQIGDTSTGTNGIINRLSDDMQQAIKDLTKKAGTTGNSQYDQSTIGRLLNQIKGDINRQNDRLLKKEDQYYRQFTAMEKAVSQFNSQSSWLYSQFSSGM